MKNKKFDINVSEFDSIDEMQAIDVELIKGAKKAALKAYSKYSKFSVGAAVLLENNEIILGSNQENAAYPSGTCAERVAVFYANSEYPDVPVVKIAIAVYADGQFLSKPISPCGSCRQVLLETETRFKTPMEVIMASEDKIYIAKRARDLLPISFDESFLP